jgi:large subunit ribosomal protein L23
MLLSDNKYSFEVAKKTTKNQIKEAVEKSFDVSVIKVNVMNIHGKKHRRGSRITMSSSWRKAVVTLKSGDKIEVFEGV